VPKKRRALAAVTGQSRHETRQCEEEVAERCQACVLARFVQISLSLGTGSVECLNQRLGIGCPSVAADLDVFCTHREHARTKGLPASGEELETPRNRGDSSIRDNALLSEDRSNLPSCRLKRTPGPLKHSACKLCA
jgi:hypothetical protein